MRSISLNTGSNLFIFFYLKVKNLHITAHAGRNGAPKRTLSPLSPFVFGAGIRPIVEPRFKLTPTGSSWSCHT